MFDLKEFNILNKHLGAILGSPALLHKIKESPWNKVYAVDHASKKYILKVGCRQLDGFDIYNEYRALLFLKQNSIRSIPSVKYYGKFHGHDLLLTHFIVSKGAINVCAAGKAFGKIHAIQGVSNSDCYSFAISLIDWLNCQLEKVSFIPLKQRYKSDLILKNEIACVINVLRRSLQNNGELFKNIPCSLINMDNSGSILMRNGRVYIVDWHLSRFGDPAWDVIRTFEYYQLDSRERTLFEKGYSAFQTDIHGMQKRMHFYSLINMMIPVFFYYADEPDLVRYKNNPLIKSNVRVQDFLSNVFKSKIKKILLHINEALPG